MTTIVEGLRTFLLADATLAGLIGTRVYPMILPQNPTLPAVTYQVIDGTSDVTTDGPTGLANPRIQIDCWGATYGAMVPVFEAVRKRLNGYRGAAGGVTVQGIFLVRQRDLYDYDAKVYRRTADWSIWNGEPT